MRSRVNIEEIMLYHIRYTSEEEKEAEKADTFDDGDNSVHEGACWSSEVYIL